jgi:hypothetical protein
MACHSIRSLIHANRVVESAVIDGREIRLQLAAACLRRLLRSLVLPYGRQTTLDPVVSPEYRFLKWHTDKINLEPVRASGTIIAVVGL